MINLMNQHVSLTRPARHFGWLAAVFLLLIFSAALARPAVAAGPEAAAATATAPRTPGAASTLSQQIGQEIYSPFCPGKTLEMCPSGQASEVRQDIQAMALEGMDKQQIIDTVVGDIGEKYRVVSPPAEDDYMLLGILFVAFLLCLVAIYFFGWRGRNKDGLEGGDEMASEEFSDEDRLYLEELRGEYLD